MRHSTVSEKNPKATKRREKTNLGFFSAAARSLGQGWRRGEAAIGLVGGKDRFGNALRQAQALTRWDRLASYWSHAFLVARPIKGRRSEVGGVPVLECSLRPRGAADQVPERNAVTIGRLADFPEGQYPNVALVAFKLDDEEAEAILERALDPNLDRLRYPLWELLGEWREYLWSLGEQPNPLLEGMRLFNAAYCEMAYEAAGIDLVPGASERNSTPEHMWHAGLWWWRQFEEAGHPVRVQYAVRERGLAAAEALSPQIPPEELD